MGAEYIIMEKATGVPLFQSWGTMTEFEKLQLIKNLTKIEAQLAAVKFPAYGGLYLRTDISRSNRSLDGDIDPSQSFYIGPTCDRAFYTDVTPEFNNGPCAFLQYFDTIPMLRMLIFTQGTQFPASEYPLHSENCFEYQKKANRASRTITRELLINNVSS